VDYTVGMAHRIHTGHLLQRPARYFEVMLIERLHAAGHTDLTVAHTSVFSVIDAEGTAIGVLARRAGVTKQAMSQLVDDLVVKGYVERHEDPHDRRSRLVILTEKSLALSPLSSRFITEIEDGYRAALGPEGFDTLRELLEKIQPPQGT
jgi:DNA-binding MarR family transcriptional regulator